MAGRKGVDAIVTVILLILLVIAVVAATWYFISRMQGDLFRSAEEGAEGQAEATGTMLTIDSAYSRDVYIRNIGKSTIKRFDLFINEEKVVLTSSPQNLAPGQSEVLTSSFEIKKGDWVKVVGSGGVYATYLVERSRAGRCGNLKCEFPADESCVSCQEDCGRCADGLAGAMYPTNAKLGNDVAVELLVTAKLQPESATAVLQLPNRTVELLPMQDYGGVWRVNRTTDAVGVYSAYVRVKERKGPYLPDVRAGFASTAEWGSPDWKARRAIFASETAGFERDDEYVRYNYTGLLLATGSCGEIKMTDQFGSPLPFQIASGGSGWCEVIAPFDAKDSLDEQVLGYIYYDNPKGTAAPVSQDVLPFNPAAGCMENSRMKLCFGTAAGDGAITFLSTDIVGKDANLLATHTRDSGYFRSGIQPEVDYSEGLDLIWCSNYTPEGAPQVLETGPVYQLVEYSFSTTCSGRKYGYTEQVEIHGGKNEYSLLLRADTPLLIGKWAPTKILGISWDPNALVLTPDGTTCNGDVCFHWSDIIRSPSNIGVGVTPYFVSEYVVYTSLAPPNSYSVNGGVQIPADTELFRTKTYFATRDDIFMVANYLSSTIRNRLESSVALGDEERE